MTSASLRIPTTRSPPRTSVGWPYRSALEARLHDVAGAARQFNIDGDKTLMFRSALACTGCHQAGH